MGRRTSALATLTVLAPPVVTEDPTSLVVCEGEAAAFTVAGDSPLPITYQWRRDGVELTGETTATLTFDAVAPADAGEIDVVLTSDCGFVVSALVSLTVEVPPTIETAPVSSDVCVGNSVTRRVCAWSWAAMPWAVLPAGAAGRNYSSLPILW